MSKLPEYEIYAIRYAKQDKRAEGHMFLGGDHNKMIQGLDFFTYALKGAGRNWIVDTGMTEPKAKRMGRAYDFICRPSEALARIGIDAKSEPDVILTHAHFDHVGTMEDYPKARFHIQDEEMIHVTGRDMTHRAVPRRLSPRGHQAPDRPRLWGAHGVPRRRRGVGAGDRVPLLGGHARGQAVLRVHTARGWVILASDAVHVFEETDEERPFAIFYDLPGMLEGYRRINRLAGSRDLIIPGHDARVTKAYPAAAPGLEGQILRLDKPPKW